MDFEEKKKEAGVEDKKTKAAELNYLSPFLVTYDHGNVLSREEALQVKEACLKANKERVAEKAHIIQSRLDELNSVYQKKQLAYSKTSDTMTLLETDEHVKFCDETLFKIHILEKRLGKVKEKGPVKHAELEKQLRADPVLKKAFA